MTIPFLDQRMDTRITRGAQGGPTVPGRTKVYLPGGKLTQSFNATMPLHKYDVSHGLRSAADFQTLVDLWYVISFTPYTGFRYKDWRDYIATRVNTTLTLISGTTWQLQRTHTFGGITFKRDIVKPCLLPAVIVYDAGGSTMTGTLDTTTGLWTGAGTPHDWTGEFDIPVTFTDNEWMGTLEVHTDNLHVTSGEIKLEEIRLE